MFLDVQSLNLLLSGGAQPNGMFDDLEHDRHSDHHPGNDEKDTQTLGHQEGRATPIEQTTVQGEKSGEYSAHRPTYAVDRDCAHRIVDFGHLVKKSDGQRHYDTDTDADRRRPANRDHIAPCGNGHQSAQGRVEGHGYVRLPIAQPSKDHGSDAGYRCCHVGGAEDRSSQKHGLIPFHPHGGTAVEAKPAKPEDKDS